MANQLAGEQLYDWSIVGASMDPVRASNGISVTPDKTLAEALNLDALFVCSGNQVQHYADPSVVTWLRAAAKRDMVLGAVCTGTYLLAKSDALDGCRCTIHWENMASAREEFPHLVISPELFEIDGDRYTSAGGTAPLDMFLHEIRNTHGSDLASAITEQFMCDRIRDKHDRQRVPLTQRIGTNQPKLAEAVSLMEANIEEPMTLDELSFHVGLSRRQLERLFQRYLQCVPTRYYLELRLERARQLLLQTSMPIVDIALACGFISAPHFSKCYRDTFGLPPRDERRKAAGQVDAAREQIRSSGSKKVTTLRRTTVCSASAPTAAGSAAL
ncbi:AraC family transcriptional regulator [Chromatiales bacterium (ex Bugula neritina AB1)]|nr:AraC family transcriptional regulator [Chromatiales bacterium (ex Bugula neritina AB1)]